MYFIKLILCIFIKKTTLLIIKNFVSKILALEIERYNHSYKSTESNFGGQKPQPWRRAITECLH